MPRHAAGNRPVDDEPGPVAPDPRHRPVLLHVAPRPHSRPITPRPLPATIGTALAVAAGLGLTVVSGWAGWRVAEAGDPASVLVAAPEVPRIPGAAPGVLPADSPAPATPLVPAGHQPSLAEVIFSDATAGVPGTAAAVPGATARGPVTITGAPASSVVVAPAAAVPPAHLSAPRAPAAAAPTVATPPPLSPAARPSLAAPSPAPVASVTPPAARPTATSGPADSTRPRPRVTGTPSAPGHRDEETAQPSGDRPGPHGDKSSPAGPRGHDGHRHHHGHGPAATSGRPTSDGQGYPAGETSRTCPSTPGK